MANALDLRSMTRREFLRLGSASMLSLLAISKTTYAYAHTLSLQDSADNLGRITTNKVDMFSTPSIEAKPLKTLWKDLVLPITKKEISISEPSHNRIWYQLDGQGFVHSAYVQPVKISLNEIRRDIPEKGQLAEVTVPFTDAIWNPLLKNIVAYRLYYSSTHWITGTLQDARGNDWYEVQEDFYKFKYYVNPAHLRVILPADVEPISPQVSAQEKRLEVHLKEQVVVAYEGDTPVQMMRCSGGTEYYNGYLTPTGSFRTDYKRPSRHMVNGSLASSWGYDLPGVPWICYFTEEGVAFHGTYWHNDFGRPRSHGCINLLSESARWLYRWTLPSVPYAEQLFSKAGGTRVEIVI